MESYLYYLVRLVGIPITQQNNIPVLSLLLIPLPLFLLS